MKRILMIVLSAAALVTYAQDVEPVTNLAAFAISPREVQTFKVFSVNMEAKQVTFTTLLVATNGALLTMPDGTTARPQTISFFQFLNWCGSTDSVNNVLQKLRRRPARATLEDIEAGR